MIRIFENCALKERNTFGIAAMARRLVEFDSADDLSEIDLPPEERVMVLGGGSNVLFLGDFPGTVLVPCDRTVRVVDPERCVVEAGAGVVLDSLCARLAAEQLWGMENLSGIPGTLGGAAVQNVGAYGAEFADVVERVDCFDLTTRSRVSLSPAELDYGYRHSVFKRPENRGRYVVTGVVLRLSREPRRRLDYGALASAVGAEASAMEIRSAVLAVRGTKLPDPAVTGSAGSFFKNPVVDSATVERIAAIEGCEPPSWPVADGRVKISAAWLIDRCGWKGRTLTPHARVWDRQPLVIVNSSGRATAADITLLETAIIHSVANRYGVILTAETEHII